MIKQTIPLITSVLITSSLFLSPLATADSTLNVNYAKSDDKRGKIFNFWDVENKIFSGRVETEGNFQGVQRKLNFIRTLGGWRGSENGSAIKDFSGDLYSRENGNDEYSFDEFIEKIKEYRENGIDIYQIVLDNPPWDFQNNYTLVDDFDGENFLKSTEIETYGNALPPDDNGRWTDFIKATIERLVEEFGEDVVKQWRFRIGSEIDTTGHWRGTASDFFGHYRRTLNAVRSVLPDAIVGVHFREATFAPVKNGQPLLDYRGNVISSFGNRFIDFAHRNNVDYDFFGVSYYPFFDRLAGGLGGLDTLDWYDEAVKPFKDNNNLKSGVDFEIHEFWLFTNFRAGLFVDAGTSHGSAFIVRLARMAYERSVRKVHQWGYGSIGDLLAPQRVTMNLLETMVNEDRYRYTSTIQTQHNNRIDAIFSSKGAGQSQTFNALISNYSDNPRYQSSDESIKINMTLPVAPGQNYEYRILPYGQNESGFNRLKGLDSNYRTNENRGGWIRNDANATYGHIRKSIGGSGQVRRDRIAQLTDDANSLTRFNTVTPSSWKSASTNQISNSSTASLAEIDIELESFMLAKVEVRLVEDSANDFGDAWYKIQNVETGRFLDGNNADLVTSASQTGFDKQWKFVPQGDLYNIDIRKNSGTGTGILRTVGSDSSIIVTNRTPRNDGDKKFDIVEISDGVFTIRSTNTDKFLQNSTDDTVDGTSNRPGMNRRARWRLIRVN